MPQSPICLIQALVLSLCLIGSVEAVSFTELGDTGALMGTAQVPTGSGELTAIHGTLHDFDGVDDVDLYQIYIADTALFSVSPTASLSVDNDTMLYLFDNAGQQVLFDDDSGDGYLPLFSAGSLAQHSAGFYYLAFDLFMTTPLFTDGLLSGWTHDPLPLQSGNYTLTLTGVEFAPSSVPVPAAAWLFGSGVIGLISVSRRMKTVGGTGYV